VPDSAGPGGARRAPAGYWLAAAALTAALVAGQAFSLKIVGFALAATAVGVWGHAVLGPGLAVCLLLPQQGGAFPAVLSVSDLVLLPLVLYVLFAATWRPLLRSPRLWAIGGLWLAGAVAVAIGVGMRGAGIKEVFFDAYPTYGHMTAFAVTATAGMSGAQRRRLVWWIVAGCAGSAVIGVLQVVGGDPVNAVLRGWLRAVGYPTYEDAAIHKYLWWGARKAFAAYFSPNGLGAATMFALLLALAVWASSTAAAVRRSAFAAAVVLFAGLVATISRGAAAGAIAGLLALAAHRGRAGAWASAATLVGLGAALPLLQMALLAAPSPARTAPDSAPQIGVETKQLTGAMKIQELRDTASMLRAGALFGAGYGVLWSPPSGFVLSSRTIGLSPAYGEIVYRSGLVGALAGLGAIVAFGRLWRSASPGAMRLALLGAAVTSLIDHPFLTVPGLGVAFWSAWGVLEGEHGGGA
jgi:hypothetical protein